MFPFAALINEGMTNSDHGPIVVYTLYYNAHVTKPTNFPKCCEARWLEEPYMDEMVNKA
jgi:hypothetical protein